MDYCNKVMVCWTLFIVTMAILSSTVHSLPQKDPKTTPLSPTASSLPQKDKETTPTRPPISDEALEKTLNDKRYLQRQLKCALGEAPCDPVGRRLKSLAPLVLRGSCPQCTPQEQRQIKKVLAYVQVNFPKEWNKMLQQYSG